ncbi:unnamed protein product [Brassicogethes aeneus]|uniref:Elongation factor Ts, mitochondrial n=1 Tax=Brassicogethes aeneus TaxID=1431903 RepID=A0A9P0B7Z8_BRAAE|nr:unnamed protein product [Brassicogethes aeneus]
MLLSKTMSRFFSTTKAGFAAEKSLLASLRKKTGYTFSNCKKALDMHNNDVIKAEEWLKQQAQALGWSKATKLEGRQTTQGLIGVITNRNHGVLVEVNCETDFVARNKEFQKIVEETAITCLSFINQQPLQKPFIKVLLESEQIRNLHALDGKLLQDHLALMIGSIGENASFKRAACFKTAEDIKLIGYAHPSGNVVNNVSIGRLAGIVALKGYSKNIENLDLVGKGICQHIVGMNPKLIGTDADPAENKDEEVSLIHQEYLLDESLTIKELLSQNNVEVVGFKRFECGENVSTTTNQPLQYVETCQ